MPEALPGLPVEALELLDHLMIEFGIADERIEHGGQLKDGMAHSQRVHVDEEDFVVLQFQILGMVIAVDHMVVVRYRLHQGVQLLPGVFRQIVPHESSPGKSRFLHIGQLAGGDQGAVDLFEHIHVFVHAPVQLLRLGGEDLGKRPGVQKLEHGAVAVAHLDHVIGDGGGDAEDEGQLGHLALMLDVSQRVGVVVDLDHVILVDAVDGAVGAAADLLAALNGYHAVSLFHLHHFRKAGHVQDLVYFGVDVDDAQIRTGLFQAQDHPQSGAGDILQLFRIQHHGRGAAVGQLGEDLLFDLRRVIGVDPSLQIDRHHGLLSCAR